MRLPSTNTTRTWVREFFFVSTLWPWAISIVVDVDSPNPLAQSIIPSPSQSVSRRDHSEGGDMCPSLEETTFGGQAWYRISPCAPWEWYRLACYPLKSKVTASRRSSRCSLPLLTIQPPGFPLLFLSLRTHTMSRTSLR